MIKQGVLSLRRIVRDEPVGLADDFDVICAGLIVGRIMQSGVLPTWQAHRWKWFISASTAGMAAGKNNGEAESREQAMADFRARWDGANVDLEDWKRQLDALHERSNAWSRRHGKPESSALISIAPVRP